MILTLTESLSACGFLTGCQKLPQYLVLGETVTPCRQLQAAWFLAFGSRRDYQHSAAWCAASDSPFDFYINLIPYGDANLIKYYMDSEDPFPLEKI